MKPTLLITNDDGYEADGLKALAEACSEKFEVVVVAPSKEWSTTSHTLTLMRPIEVHEVAPCRYVVEGTPTDCVHVALKRLLDAPVDLVVSGINRGANMGEDTSYSGTVAAAMEAALCGVKSFAVSATEWADPHYDAAAEFSVRMAEWLLRKKLPPRTFLNVNVPDLPSAKIKGVEWTRLGHRLYPLDVNEVGSPVRDGRRNSSRFFKIGGVALNFRDSKGTDFYAVKRGRISITPLHLDLTALPLLGRFRSGRLKIGLE